MGGGDPDVVLRSVIQQVMSKMASSPGGKNCTIEQFTWMRPSSFSREANPLVAENWVQDIEEMMAVIPSRLLEKQRMNSMAVTWSGFREIFSKRYYPITVRSAKVVKFLHLMQGSLIVQQYEVKFIELSRFASYLGPDEERKVRKFKEGLTHILFEQVISFQV
ncbi:uncharacterized protein LOC131153675 [Malania oleifera]|uniref:uncharacterized protein LOC131153675 n=1 Tax=Malania oleifera TaxID=397392 RepID=UPI0025ADF8ED|nr:uncharacterized protein LOC131153675 [Malania oleifera]